LTYILVVLALTIAVIIHESAHAFAMRKHGIAVKSFGIGFPIIPISLDIRIGSSTVLHIHPILIGAYVEPANGDDIKNLPFRHQSEIYAAGVFWNIITVAILALVTGILNGSFPLIFILLITAGVAVGIPYSSKYLAPLVPVFGAALVGFSVYSIISTPAGGDAPVVMGPVGIVNMLGSSSLSFFQMLFLISLFLGTTNMIPIPPLDGGQIFTAFLKKIGAPRLVISGISFLGIITIIFVIIFATVGDIGRVFS